jgi:hypothetical protein
MSGLSTFEGCGTLWNKSAHFGIVRYRVTCIGFRAISAIFSFSSWISVCVVIQLATVFGWRLWALCISFHELITVIVAVLIMLILGWLGLKTV